MKRFITLCAALTLALAASATAPAYAADGPNPAGNNGFIKINNETAPDSIPQNHPHVGCTFMVEFYNYDKNNDKAKVSFELQAPTNKSEHKLTIKSGNLTPPIGEDSAGGGNDLDAREIYTLGFIGQAHEKQGYHVKLTVEAAGSKGSGKKHKVFWVQPCVSTETSVNPPQMLGISTVNTQPPTTLPVTGGTITTAALLGGLAAIITYPIALFRKTNR
ncbi:MAG TPA: hypothetical protein VF733_03295 [Candidatus Saccharimonadales bacterium]